MPELRAEALRSEHSAQLELFLEYAFFARVRVPERPFATNLIALLPADDVGDEAAVAPGKGARQERRSGIGNGKQSGCGCVGAGVQTAGRCWCSQGRCWCSLEHLMQDEEADGGGRFNHKSPFEVAAP